VGFDGSICEKGYHTSCDAVFIFKMLTLLSHLSCSETPVHPQVTDPYISSPFPSFPPLLGESVVRLLIHLKYSPVISSVSFMVRETSTGQYARHVAPYEALPLSVIASVMFMIGPLQQLAKVEGANWSTLASAVDRHGASLYGIVPQK